MSLKRYAARRDQTEAVILQALAQVGAQYVLLDVWDLMVWFRGRLFMLDCKSPGGKPTATQATLVQRGWPLQFVETAEDALKAIGAL
jgi:hypothetical protein